jgi:hypothetical protein
MQSHQGNEAIPLELFIEPLRGDTIDRRQIGIEHHSVTSNQMDRAF